MLNVARVMMILAGFFGMPSVVCSSMCSSLVTEAGPAMPAGSQTLYRLMAWASFIASLGAIYVGAKARTLGRKTTGIACLIFAACYFGLIIQLNPLGIGSACLLFVAGIMAFVADEAEFQAPRPIEAP